MNDRLGKMALARGMAEMFGGGLRRDSVLLLMIFGALCFGSAGRSGLASSSPSSLAEDINQLGEPDYLVVYGGGARHLLQFISSDTTNTTNTPYLLARSRTDRPNPRHGLNKYRGGYNLSDSNYLASVVSTGLPAWIVALVWLALGLILLWTLCCVCCCCRHRTRHEYSHGRLGYLLPVIDLVIFTLAAIAGAILLYYAQHKFNNELRDTLDYVVNQSEITEAGLREVQANLTNAANINIVGVFQLSDADKAEIASLDVKLDNTANDLKSKTVNNRKVIRIAINIVRIVLIVVAAVMLALVLLGFLFSSLGIRSLTYILVLLGWVMVLGTWILCGIFIILGNGVGDTCQAMQEWVDHPETNTSLDEWLPCNGAAAASALSNSETYTVEIVNAINRGLSKPINQNPPPLTTTWYNQSGPLVPTLCSSTPCPNNTVSLADAPTVWQSYECTVDGDGLCITQGRLTPTFYSQLSSAAEDAESFTNSASFLANAANCVFVRNVFIDIHDKRCHGLRLHAKWIWIGLILVSGGNMLSILLWIVSIRRKRYRYKSNKQQQMAMYEGQSQPYSPPPDSGAVSPAAKIVKL